MNAKTWEQWYAQIEDQIASGRIIIRTGNDQGRSQHRPLIEFEIELVRNIASEAWAAGVLAGQASPEARVSLALERIADALDNGNALAEKAMEQRSSMDPSLKAMVDAAQEMVKRGSEPGGMPVLVLMRDSENGICPQTGESCTQDCGIGQPCKDASGGRIPS